MSENIYKKYSIGIGITLVFLCFFIFSIFPTSERWSSGHYLLLTIQDNDTVVYALHGKNIKTSWKLDYFILKDSIRIKKSSLLTEYHTESGLRKGWTDCDFKPDYAYNYCVNLKKKNEFIILDDNQMSIDINCKQNYNYYYNKYGKDCFNDRIE
ncbi:hypothetical protein [Tenacibaculum ovolyticum]|uniref:hypothetical protein n=1 Tax=Tenacibaculum ovolyticum TaxID=104270 RepID=UPI0007EDD5DA|nr:hypothetical protein [Tenacibaculum ovolyticum]